MMMRTRVEDEPSVLSAVSVTGVVDAYLGVTLMIDERYQELVLSMAKHCTEETRWVRAEQILMEHDPPVNRWHENYTYYLRVVYGKLTCDSCEIINFCPHYNNTFRYQGELFLGKICHRCKRKLTYDNFCKDKYKLDGYKPTCNDCRKEERLREKVAVGNC